MTEPQDAHSAQQRRPTPAQRASAFMFLAAFAATMLTVVLTGLWVRSPSARRAPETTVVTLAIGEPRSINLVFDARAPVEQVELTVDLPAGVELAERPGVTRFVGQARLAAGSNVVPLQVVARSGRGGSLAARLRHGEEQKTFVVEVAVAAP